MSILDGDMSKALDRALSGIKTLSISTSGRAQVANALEPNWQADPDSVLREQRPRPRGAPLIAEIQRNRGNMEEVYAMRSDPRNFTGVASLLQKMPGLEELTLHECILDLHRQPASRDNNGKAFHAIANTCGLRRLKKLTLRGVIPFGEDLLALLRANPNLESVDFRNMTLHGRWRPIFEHLSGVAHTINRLQFSVLFEERPTGILIYISFRGAPLLPEHGSSPGLVPHVGGSLCLEGREAVLAGDYRTVVRRVQWSLQYATWRQEQSREYGPPRT